MNIIQWLRSTLRFLILVLLMAILLLYYLVSLLVKKHTSERAFRLRRRWVKLAIRILGLHIDCTGTPLEQVSLYVSNHRSFLDPVIVAKFVDAFVIAKAEVGQMPVINWGAGLTGVIYVNREDKSSRRASRDTMVQTLKDGFNVLVYPEGTVGSEAKSLRFKTGTFQEAASLGIPVVPIAIEYKDEEDLWEGSGFYHQFIRQFGKPATYVKLRFGEPLKSGNSAELVVKTKRFIDNSLGEMQINWSERFG